jgi:lipopolysaccharide transport system permease protein
MRQLWAYRGFIRASIQREFQLKYRNSLLGVMWTVINPLCMIFIYTVIFSQVMRARLPGGEQGVTYSIYLCSGIITWFFFSEVIARSIDVFVDHASLIKKLHFPRLCLPIIVLGGATINFALMWGIFTLFLCVSGHFPGWTYLALPLVLLIQVCLGVGIGTYLGIINVFFRDIGQFFSLFLQIWFWCTPIVYADGMLSDRAKHWLQLNPMYAVVNAYHDIIVEGRWPDWQTLWMPILLGICTCLLAFGVFRKRSEAMVDEL